jgi:transcriptional regulator with XRE-family HTH domain
VREVTAVERKRGRDLHHVDEHIGAKLRERRLILGLSQEAFAAKLGITFQQVQKYEKGRNRVSSSMLWLVSDVLDVTPGYFFEGLGDRASPPITGGGGSYASERVILELARHFATLEPDLQRSVFSLVKAMARAAKAAS